MTSYFIIIAELYQGRHWLFRNTISYAGFAGIEVTEIAKKIARIVVSFIFE